MNFHLKFKNKEDYVSLAFALILLAIVFLISYLAFTSTQQAPIEQNPEKVTQPTPLVPEEEGTKPLINFDQKAEEELLEKVNNRPEITAGDALAKIQILHQLPPDKKSGILYETNSIRIEYIESADLFMVEIRDIDIAQAKRDANVWFRSQGVSQKGICNYPVMFYINSETMTNLEGSGITFSPVGNSC